VQQSALVLALAVACAALFAPSRAMANGRFPAANRIVLSPSDSDLVITRATYGVLRSEDHGATWSFLCEDALGLAQTATEDPALELTAAGALVAGLMIPAGLDVSKDQGCTWSCVGGALSGQAIVDLAVRSETSSTLVALATPTDATGQPAGPAVFQSTDDGLHWAQLGQGLDPSLLVSTVDVAPSDPHRLYVSATRGFGPGRTASLLVSLDEGTTWTERSVPLDTASEAFIYIGGVDPVDADRLYIRTGAPKGQSGATRLLVSVDGGSTFQVGLTLSGQMLGFALSPDGSKIYAGGNIDGLFVGQRETGTFARMRSVVRGGDGGAIDVHVECLAARGAELWACADDPSGFIAGVSTDDGATFEPRLQLGSVGAAIACEPGTPAALACGADASASVCSGQPFAQLCLNLGCSDGGVEPQSPAATPAPSWDARGGCSSVASPGAGLLAAAGVSAALAVGRRRRRR
jgi:photosystem II stability/assembly factor-like uncharacterized protein